MKTGVAIHCWQTLLQGMAINFIPVCLLTLIMKVKDLCFNYLKHRKHYMVTLHMQQLTESMHHWVKTKFVSRALTKACIVAKFSEMFLSYDIKLGDRLGETSNKGNKS